MIRVVGAGELRACGKRLQQAGRTDLRRELSKEIGAATKPAVKDLRVAIMRTGGGAGGTGLRRRIARSVRQRVRLSGNSVGVTVSVVAGRMPPGESTLPALLEGIRPWRHPVYGNRRNWVTQRSHPYFEQALRPYPAKVQAAAGRAIDNVLSRI